MIRFDSYRFDVEREPFKKPLQFKGSSFTEKWLNIVGLEAPDGERVAAIGGNAVLWSDPGVFFAYSETGGNLVQSMAAERAVQAARGRGFAHPVEALHALFPDVHRFAAELTARPGLSRTFTLNAMVALDLALWKLLAAERGTERLDELIPDPYRSAFTHRQRQVARVPMVGYNTSASEITGLMEAGHRVLKLKIGRPGDPDEMLREDQAMLERVHGLAEGSGRAAAGGGEPPLYYLDANGRYPDRATLMRLVEWLDARGMLERTVLLEEPFPPDSRESVEGIPVRVAADESVHSLEDVRDRYALGYGAFALKPAGKTLSFALETASEADRLGVPCFVADSACVPLLLEWNRVVAALLPPFPGLDTGLLESNGPQNYARWDRLQAEHPIPDAPWLESRRGVFALDERFFAVSGGVFREARPQAGRASA